MNNNDLSNLSLNACIGSKNTITFIIHSSAEAIQNNLDKFY